MRKLWLYSCIAVLSFISICILPIHSEEKDIRVFIKDVEIEEDTKLDGYFKEVRIDVQANLNISSLDIILMQNEKQVEIEKHIQKDKNALFIIVPVGENFTFRVKGIRDGKPLEWSYDKHPFQVVMPVPIMLNQQPLLDYQVIQTPGTLHVSAQENMQMNQSFIMVDNQKKIWEKVNNGYEYQIEKSAVYSMEFHFVNLQGCEITQTSIIVKENEAIESEFFIRQQPLSSLTQFYNEDTILTIQADVMDVHNLEVYINDTLQEVSWKEHEKGYQSEVFFEDEKNYHIQLFYRGDDHLLLVKEVHFVIDKQAPILQMTLDRQEYYQEQVIIDIVAKDINFLTHSFIRDELENNNYSTWIKKDDAYHMQIVVSKEGVHNLQFQCQDEAGNTAILYENNSIVDTLEIVIDKTVPNITTNLAKSNASVIVQKQYAQFLIQDTNLNDENVLVNVYQNQEKYYPEISKTRIGQDMNIEFMLDEDGFYEIEIIAEDLAKHSAIVKKSIQIDCTKPLVSLSSMQQAITNQDVTLAAKGFDSAIQSYVLTVKRDDSIIKEDVYLENFEIGLDFHEDDGTHNYEVILFGKDKAGNEHKITSTFVLDKEAPFIQPFFQQQPYHSNIITNSPLDVFVTWHDSNLESAELLLYKNGELMDQQWIEDSFYKKRTAALASRKDQYQYKLKVQDKAGNASEVFMDITLDTYMPPLELVKEFQSNATNQTWVPTLLDIQKDLLIQDVTLFKNQKEIPYVWGTPIAEDGYYQLFVSAKDTIGNVSSLQPFHFIIDKTAPAIHFLDKQTRQEMYQIYEGAPTEIQIHTGFLQKDKIVSILLNEKELMSEELSQYDIKVEPGNHKLVVVAVDEAGNKTEEKIDMYVSKHSKTWVKTSIYLAFILIVITLTCKKLRCFF